MWSWLGFSVLFIALPMLGIMWLVFLLPKALSANRALEEATRVALRKAARSQSLKTLRAKLEGSRSTVENELDPQKIDRGVRPEFVLDAPSGVPAIEQKGRASPNDWLQLWTEVSGSQEEFVKEIDDKASQLAASMAQKVREFQNRVETAAEVATEERAAGRPA